ncbi:hypothetical protein F9Z84_06925 [Escherichia coli]|nr:hypothetical protein F9Z84_06925 [Escherichia coli]
MATEFKYLKFGLVPTTFDAATLESSERIIKSFLGSFNAFNLLDDAASHKEIFTITRRYIGPNFRNWLIVNFRNGGGARKELVRKMVGYIMGRLAGRTVIAQLKIDFNRIQNLSKNGEVITTSIIYDEYEESRNHFRVEDVDFSVIEDRHFYDIMALIGPELAAKFCLSLDGIYYDC